jgi:ABC-type bacteriocin/lantibiotic exporter with double-glycine peptidase domain
MLMVALGPSIAAELFRRPYLTRRLLAQWHMAEYLGEDGVIRQSTSYDCGIACLQMILNERGVAVSAELIRSKSGIEKRGISMLKLKQVASQYGLKASTWKLREEDVFGAPMPLIAFIDRSHFVVVSQVTSDSHLIVLDPSAGKLRYSLQSFKNRWQGEVILFRELQVERR